jgi:uncharacterized protein YlxW (UPF0749 family)
MTDTEGSATGPTDPDDATADTATSPPASGEPAEITDDATDDQRPRRHIGVVAIILVAVLGFGIAVQIRDHDAENLQGARTEDLVRILADLDSQRTRLRDEITDLSNDRDELTTGSQGRQAALERAEELADSVGILAGTLAATGPGLILTFEPGGDPIRAAVMLDAIEELRGAGAEAMQLDGDGSASVRVVAATYFAEQGDHLLVDDVELSPSYRLTVIGDPDTMDTALNIPGGVADTVKKDGGTVIVRQPGTVDVTTLAEAAPPEYAKPVN